MFIKYDLVYNKTILINLSGQVVYYSEINEGENNHNITMIDELNSGVYIFRVSDNHNSMIKMIMKK